MTGLILNLLLSIRENYTIQGKKKLGLSLVTLPFSRALYPPPPPPNKTRVIFRPTLGAREFSSAVSGFQTPIFNVDLHLRTLSKFPGYGEVTHPLAQLELEVQHRCVIFPTQSLAEKSHCEDQKNT